MPTPPEASEEAKARAGQGRRLAGQEGAVPGGPTGSQPAWWDGAGQNFHGASQVWKQCSRCLFQLFGQPGSPVPGATPAERPRSIESTRSPGGLATGQHNPCGSDSRKGTRGLEGRGKTHILWAHALCSSSSPEPWLSSPSREHSIFVPLQSSAACWGVQTLALACCRGQDLNFQGEGCSVVQSTTPVGSGQLRRALL